MRCKKIKWYQKPIRRNSKILKDLRKLCEFYQIKVRYQNKVGNCAGHANLNTDTISVYLFDSDDRDRETIADVISTVTHEMGHVLNKRNRKYYPYHSPKNEFTVSNSKYILRHGFNAEIHTDKLGKKLTNLHFPGVRYKRGYIHCKSDKKWYRENYLQDFKDYLNARRKKK